MYYLCSMKPINISGLEHYEITEDGQVYSKLKERWIKPSINSCGYYMYSLQDVNHFRKFYMVSRLVCITYVSDPPTPKYDVHHKDHNRMNNHYTNLEWLTRSENVLRSYKENNRCHYWKCKPSPGLETRRFMAEAKEKKVVAYYCDELVGEFNSIQKCLDTLKINRKFFNRVLNGSNSGPKSSLYKFIL